MCVARKHFDLYNEKKLRERLGEERGVSKIWRGLKALHSVLALGSTFLDDPAVEVEHQL